MEFKYLYIQKLEELICDLNKKLPQPRAHWASDPPEGTKDERIEKEDFKISLIILLSFVRYLIDKKILKNYIIKRHKYVKSFYDIELEEISLRDVCNGIIHNIDYKQSSVIKYPDNLYVFSFETDKEKKGAVDVSFILNYLEKIIE